MVVLALVLGGAAYGVNAKGDAKAKDYEKALDAWNDQRNDLLDAPAEANSDLWDFEDPTTKKSLKKQKAACERVLTLRESAAKNAAAVPKASDSFFKLLSSAEREAIKESEAREKAVKAYAKAADKVLVQMHEDCAWNIQANAAKDGDSGAKKIFDKAKDLLLKPGHSSGTYYCRRRPRSPASRRRCRSEPSTSSWILKALRVDKAYFMKKFFAPERATRRRTPSCAPRSRPISRPTTPTSATTVPSSSLIDPVEHASSSKEFERW